MKFANFWGGQVLDASCLFLLFWFPFPFCLFACFLVGDIV